ncbi:MAG: HdeA/HdeB family chaperone [Hyphomicrobium sp.]
MLRYFAGALAAAVTIVSTLPASAESVDAAAFSCKELTEAYSTAKDDDVYGATAILTWLAGYHATDEQGTVVDFDTLAKDTERVAQYCLDNPNIGLMTAAGKYMGENATPITKEAVDISTVKCERLANSTEKDTEGAGIVLMWLAGYYASYDEETIIDFDELQRQGGEIGVTCRQTQQMSLVTAAKKAMQVE